ncbi:TonB-dependent receptor [Robiginitalea sp. SC105]|uniref:TonB-dependent receptor n=1 Tax=Robiginitalea sp. SC105 TaxID=2762332 RepID=UPI00163B1FD2|nr:TonB-dependent receptor [Robiginitalea sp. SC105]MBC2838016.1 TonB-dependent receptor [Robiginitalea sp. SC105]
MKFFPNQLLPVLLFLIWAPLSLGAQQIGIYDRETGEPLADVAVFNADRTTTGVSDAAGQVSIAGFDRRERIFFKHIGYQPLNLVRSTILAQGGRVFLELQAEQLQEVVMSVSKWEQQKREVPQKIETIGASDVAFGNPQTSADLLQQSGKVFVQKSQYGGGSPMIRGFATNRVLLAVDGVRMNNAIFRGGNLQNVLSIDPFVVRKTEVLFGPGSVIYGSDAIGGVMNFYTRDAHTSQGDSLLVMGNVAYRTATASGEQTLHGDVNLGFDQWGSLTSITYNRFGDLRMGSHGPDSYLRPNYVVTENGTDRLVENDNPRRQVPSGYDQVSLMQKFKYRPDRQLEFNMGLHYSETSDYSRYDRLIRPSRDGDGLRSAEWYYGPQKWFMGNLRMAHTGGSRFYQGLKVSAAYQFFEESRNDRGFGDDILFRTRERVGAYSLNLDFETKKMGDLRLYYGAEYIGNTIQSDGSEEDIRTGDVIGGPSRYPDGSSWQSAAAYASASYRIKPNLTMLAGLRYSHVWIAAEFETDYYNLPFDQANLDNGALSGSLGLSWFPGRNTQVTLNGSTGFRAPNIDDIGKIFDSEPGSVVVPNPDLEPEYAYNAEIGLRQNIRDRLVLKGAAYYTYLVDALVRRDFTFNGQQTIEYNGETSNVQAIQNAARAFVYGLELGFDATLSEHWSLAGNYTITQGTEEEEDGSESPARHAAPDFADLQLTYSSYPFRAALFLNYNGEVPFEDLAFSERSKTFIYAADAQGNPFSPSWYTLNFRSSYTFLGDYRLTLAVENITDQRYRTYSSGIAAPGLNVVAGLNVRF